MPVPIRASIPAPKIPNLRLHSRLPIVGIVFGSDDRSADDRGEDADASEHHGQHDFRGFDILDSVSGGPRKGDSGDDGSSVGLEQVGPPCQRRRRRYRRRCQR